MRVPVCTWSINKQFSESLQWEYKFISKDLLKFFQVCFVICSRVRTPFLWICIYQNACLPIKFQTANKMIFFFFFWCFCAETALRCSDRVSYSGYIVAISNMQSEKSLHGQIPAAPFTAEQDLTVWRILFHGHQRLFSSLFHGNFETMSNKTNNKRVEGTLLEARF